MDIIDTVAQDHVRLVVFAWLQFDGNGDLLRAMSS